MLEIQRRLCGQDHQETLETQVNLCDNYLSQRRCLDAETFIQDTLQKFRRLLGNHHQDTLSVESRLASCLNFQRRFEEAETIAKKILLIAEQTSTPSLVVANAMVEHGIACHGQGRVSEALILQGRAVELSIRVYGLEHPTTYCYKSRLAEVERDLAQTKALVDASSLWPITGNYMAF